jgi:hypothetical protein
MAEVASAKLSRNSSSGTQVSAQLYGLTDYCVTDHNNCRLCQGQLVQIADFGPVPPIFFSDERQDTLGIDLILVRCIECGLVQLSKSIERDPPSSRRTAWSLAD